MSFVSDASTQNRQDKSAIEIRPSITLLDVNINIFCQWHIIDKADMLTWTKWLIAWTKWLATILWESLKSKNPAQSRGRGWRMEDGAKPLFCPKKHCHSFSTVCAKGIH